MPPRPRVRPASIVVALAVFALLASSAHAAPRIRITSPQSGATLSRVAGFSAKAPRAKKVVFFLDRRRVWVDRRAPWRLPRGKRLPRVRPGTHTVGVRGYWSRGRKRSDRVRVHMHGAPALKPGHGQAPGEDPQSPVGASPEPTAPPPPGGTRAQGWSDGFESEEFSAGWTWWGQGQEELWGHISVIDPAAETVPPLEGTKVARFETTPDDIVNKRWHAKLFHGFYYRAGGSRYSYADVSGSYRSSYYFPDTYRVPDETAVITTQFKEQFRDPDGTWHQDPVWWAEVRNVTWMKERPHVRWHGAIPARGEHPVLFLNFRGAPNNTRTLDALPVPTGRWLELRADITHGSKIDWFVDGVLLGTSRATEYPVSPVHGAGSEDWIFGIGNYSGGANGPLYADAASYTP